MSLYYIVKFNDERLFGSDRLKTAIAYAKQNADRANRAVKVYEQDTKTGGDKLIMHVEPKAVMHG